MTLTKNISLTLLFLFLFSGCNDERSKQVEYKVIPAIELWGKEFIGIIIKINPVESAHFMENKLSILGKDGWRLVDIVDSYAIFVRE
jgi:hypothetical protein